MTTYVWLILVLAVAGVVLGAVSYLAHLKTERLLKKLFQETGHEQFGEVLLSHQRQLRRNEGSLKDLTKRAERLENDSHFLLSQVGLVKYNPFENSGGNISFSLALLNNNGDGAVLTSLHSREGIRVYSKKVERFSGEQSLTEEEKQAVERARRPAAD